MFARVNDDTMQISISYHQQFKLNLLRLRNSDQMFSWFFERSRSSYREKKVSCQKRYLEISCEYVGEVHFFFRFNISLNPEQVGDNIAYASVEFLDKFTASTNISSMISLGRLVIP